MENWPSYDFPNIGPLLGGSPQRAIPLKLLMKNTFLWVHLLHVKQMVQICRFLQQSKLFSLSIWLQSQMEEN